MKSFLENNFKMFQHCYTIIGGPELEFSLQPFLQVNDCTHAWIGFPNYSQDNTSQKYKLTKYPNRHFRPKLKLFFTLCFHLCSGAQLVGNPNTMTDNHEGYLLLNQFLFGIGAKQFLEKSFTHPSHNLCQCSNFSHFSLTKTLLLKSWNLKKNLMKFVFFSCRIFHLGHLVGSATPHLGIWHRCNRRFWNRKFIFCGVIKNSPLLS